MPTGHITSKQAPFVVLGTADCGEQQTGRTGSLEYQVRLKQSNQLSEKKVKAENRALTKTSRCPWNR